ncbi:nuclear transport factor 2 family protein [Variovorax paradoxus]|uniref:nuclear transport factor 2 family protein n=1 Tax=Variovorax paradoxus TaxID=34073 RepID=UPI002480DFBD|nr:nuclear transport factor 2 family protein [Variovorax paradoxus]WGT64457.1 nuclear transport factor 2 family protein [Variovorax paradoxus]
MIDADTMHRSSARHWRTAARLDAGKVRAGAQRRTGVGVGYVRKRRARRWPPAYLQRSITPPKNRMTPEQNKRTISDAWKAFASHDPARIAAWFTEDAEWLAPQRNATALALGIPHHMIGSKAIVHFLAEMFPKLFVSDVTVNFRSRYCERDTVIVELRIQAMLANGRKYDNDYCFIFELRDGRIVRMREYMDTQKGHACIFG